MAKDKLLQAAEIVELDEIQHVLQRKEMYIGNGNTEPKTDWVPIKSKGIFTIANFSYNEGYFKLVQEILDNAVDEYLKTNGKKGNKISVTLEDNNKFIFKDNGRGINSAKTDGISQVEKAFTKLRSSSNFSGRGEQAGLNGVGAALTNIFSKSFKVTTCDGKNTVILECADNLSKKSVKYKSPKSDTGTEIEFELDVSKFGNMEGVTFNVMYALLYKRLVELHTAFPDLKLQLNGEKVDKTITDLLTAPENYVGRLYKDDALQFGIFFSGDKIGKDLSYVNGLCTSDGGKHIEYYSEYCLSAIKKIIDKKNGVDTRLTAIKDKIFFVLILTKFKDAKFSSQNKTKMINSLDEIKTYIPENKVDRLIKNFLKDYEDHFRDLVDELNNEHYDKVVKDHNKAMKKKKIENFIEALGKDRKKCSIYLAEGLSAKATFVECRDQVTQAILPLKGKILNCYSEPIKNVLANDEICNMMKCIGLQIGVKAKQENLNYGFINITTDADPDGESITALLMVFFYKFWPELYDMGVIRKTQSPVVIANKGKTIKRYYDIGEYQAEKNKLTGYTVNYIKGLGSLELDEYSLMISDSTKDLSIKVDDVEKVLAKLELLFGDDADRRKVWLTNSVS